MSEAEMPLSPDRLVGRFFRFSSGPTKQLLAPRLVFRSDGSLSGYRHRNEARWRIDDGRLVILDVNNKPSCIFTSRDVDGPSLGLSGQFLLKNDGPKHHLDELPPASQVIGSLPDTLAFEGEFGEELNSFIPYVHWLYQNGELAGRKIATYAGMEPFYFFLDPQQLILRSLTRRYVAPNAAPPYYLHPSGLSAHRVGLEWAPDYRTKYATNFGFTKPLLVIHNKYTAEWEESPVNYFKSDTLDKIFRTLKDRYQIVFFEAARRADSEKGYSLDHQPLILYNDVEIARAHPEVLVFGDLLRQTPDSYNLLKLKIFSSCYHFITVQGGNAHMCALFPGSLVAIQHVKGGEEGHAYQNGIFQFLANPHPIYLIGRNGAALLEILAAFEDCTWIDDRVHLGTAGIALYERFNPRAWRSVPMAHGR